ncbi:MAG: NUDIX domain-containing protein [Spirochaetaceae bacterium]|jgi:8-oxo-dGTP diphosphatase|nr:NUDIX domain-containing protein [Spirochaetaceae bacterium]
MKKLVQKRHTNIPASYLVLIKNNKTLLLRRFQTGFEDGKYSVIAGHVEPGENFTQCIIREAEEEAGIIVKRENLQVVHVMHRDSRPPAGNERVDVFFTSEIWDGEITNNEPDKCDDLAWFDLDNLPENIIPFIKEALVSIRKSINYSEYGWS